jgi:AraC family transcriptional regulator, regulatory protein of adaptative response / methylated-DNA-[protein]-cysteine methyltransferase
MTNQLYTTPEARWGALAERDKAAMDAFIYAVKSTGVYCRPLCGSRLPRKDNVIFYDSTTEAESAGYRACKQCRPDQPLIRYTIAQSSLGLVLIAESQAGICTIAFGASRKALIDQLKQEHQSAKIVAADELMQEKASAVQSLIDDGEGNAPLALDRQGTAFQKQVWDALAKVPRGETRTYSQIASAIGQPDATRAVALACAANRLAVIIPCHRVIRQDGSLSGYRWGPERKRTLLAREGVPL